MENTINNFASILEIERVKRLWLSLLNGTVNKFYTIQILEYFGQGGGGEAP